MIPISATPAIAAPAIIAVLLDFSAGAGVEVGV